MFQFGGAWNFVWGLRPQKPPRDDGTASIAYSKRFFQNCNPISTEVMMLFLISWGAVAVVNHRRNQGAMPSEFLAYLIILRFEKRRPKQKYCCSPKIKHFGPPNRLGWLRYSRQPTHPPPFARYHDQRTLVSCAVTLLNFQQLMWRLHRGRSFKGQLQHRAYYVTTLQQTSETNGNTLKPDTRSKG